jgi:ATP phosphoribosyltransferase regulatory subunit
LPELADLLAQLPHATWFAALGQLSGDVSILATAQELFSDAPQAVKDALAQVQAVAQALQSTHPHVALSIDLSELRGYHYHTGLVFAAYTPRSAAEIAKGGRYDHIGEAFGRARPATGFSADLNALVDFFSLAVIPTKIFAPAHVEPSVIAQLRAQNYIVIQVLAGDNSSAQQLACQQQLLLNAQGVWQIHAL